MWHIIYLSFFLIINSSFGVAEKCYDSGVFSCSNDCNQVLFCPTYNEEYAVVEDCRNNNSEKNQTCFLKHNGSGGKCLETSDPDYSLECSPHSIPPFKCTSAGLFPNIFKNCQTYYICLGEGKPASECACPVGKIFDLDRLYCVPLFETDFEVCTNPEELCADDKEPLCGQLSDYDEAHYFYFCSNHTAQLYYCDQLDFDKLGCSCAPDSETQFDILSGYQKGAVCETLE